MNDDHNNSKLDSKKKFQSWFIPEPLLKFGNKNTHIDPKIGLTLYGPLESINAHRSLPTSIKIGIIGTGQTISMTNRFLDKLTNKISGSINNPILHPEFPGFKNVFNCNIIKSEQYNEIIPNDDVNKILNESIFERLVKRSSKLFVNRIENISERVPKPNVVICALPQEIVTHCVVKRTSAGRRTQTETRAQKKLKKQLREYSTLNQKFLDNFEDTAKQIIEEDVETTDFWKELKIGAMKFGMPTQIAWPSTLEIDKITQQDSATIAWNFAVGLHYKGSGFPWTMTEMERGTCYVGISFFRDPADGDNKMRTSMAQMFTWNGEGLILRGEKFEWNDKKDKSPHLDEIGAKKLLKQVIDIYSCRMGQLPFRIVIHKSSRYWDNEKKGFESALSGVKYHDFVAFADRDIRFFRYGKFPPLRGTVIELTKTNHLLYTRGFVPYLQTYPGAHVPLPLDIIEHHGDYPSDKILTEILALSKMNWNSADFSLAMPITIVFSKRVGTILARLPKGHHPKHEYLYYM